MYRQCGSTLRLVQHAYKGLSASARYKLYDPIAIHRRNIYHTSLRFAATDRSKVEHTLKMLKDDLETQQEDARKLKLVPVSEVAKKLTIKEKVVHELKHYYHGFRLLALETRLAAKYLFRIIQGKGLTRRERQQLVRTVSDLFRLVPFSIFIIVPFMELALPVFIKLFPNMLPSTFQEKNKEEEKISKQLKVRVEMAKFLQDTIEEIALEKRTTGKDGKQSESRALDFARFIKKVRSEGGYVSNEELFKFSKLFEDELTLDNLSMSQLRALCKILAIQPLGTPEILRFQINLKLRELKADDKQIAAEGGVEALSIADLQAACRARGMRAQGLSEQRLRDQLGNWLELSQNDKVPPSLLLMSRTMYLPEDISFTDRLKNIVQNLPEGIAEQTRQKLTEMEGGTVDHKARIDLVRSVEDAIKAEKELAKKQASEKAKVEAAEGAKLKAQAEAEAQAAEDAKKTAEVAEGISFEAPTAQSVLGDAAQAAKGSVDAMAEHVVAAAKEIATNAAKRVETAKAELKVEPKDLTSIEDLIHGGAIQETKHDILGLKEKVIEHTEDLIEVGALDGAFAETKVARKLRLKLNNMIENVDTLVTKLEDEKRVVDETIADPALPEDDMLKKERQVRIKDLIESLIKLKTVTDEAKRACIEEVLGAIDQDKDGIIDADLVIEVIALMEKHSDVPISPSQMTAMIQMLRKEDKAEALSKSIKLDITEPILPQGELMDDEKKPNNGPLDVPDLKVPPTVQLNKDGSPKKTQTPHV